MIDNIFDLPDDEIEVVPPGMELANCLVVPPRARTPEENGGIDELAQWEAEFRRSETLPVYFTDGNAETDGVETWENNPAFVRFMGLAPDAPMTLAEALAFEETWRAGKISRWAEPAPPVSQTAPGGTEVAPAGLDPPRGRARSSGDPRPGDPQGYKVV